MTYEIDIEIAPSTYNIDLIAPFMTISTSGGGSASDVSVDTSAFDNNLSSSDDDVLKALNTIDDIDLSVYAQKSNVLELDNTTSFTPDGDYEPATKKYVDDNAGGGTGIVYEPFELGGQYAIEATDLISSYLLSSSYILPYDQAGSSLSFSKITVHYKHVSGDTGSDVTSEPKVQPKVNGSLVDTTHAVSTTWQSFTLSAGYNSGDILDLALTLAEGTTNDDAENLIIRITFA